MQDSITIKGQAPKTPSVAFRAAIHNQIYYTCYYHVSKYVPGKSKGTWVCRDSWGYRGRGNALGMSLDDANEVADRLNKEAGWTASSPNRPKWMQ